MKKLFTLAGLLCLGLAAQAQYSLKRFEINNTPGFGNGSEPWAFTSFKGQTYFFADDGTFKGRQLWSTDGVTVTREQTKGGLSMWYSSRPEMQALGDYLYFPAAELAYAEELYRFDGTKSELVIDLEAGQRGGGPNRLITADNKLYFWGGLYKKFGIWKHEPVAGSTTKVLDYAQIGTASLNVKFIPFNGKMMFTADDSLTGNELFEMDLKTNLFRRVADINPGPASSGAFSFVVYKNILFFLAKTDAHGYELYMYNGKDAPVRLTDIAPGPANSFDLWVWDELMGGFGNKLYFTPRNTQGTYDLYGYDIVSKQVTLEYALNSYDRADDFVVYGHKLFFVDADYTLMVMDENAAPVPFNTLNIGPPVYGVANLAVSHGKLFFGASDGNGDTEPYVFIDSVALGVPEITVGNGVTAYPNPANSLVQIGISLNENTVLQVVLTDMLGRTVYSAKGKSYASGRHQITVPVQELAAGNYIYTIASSEGAILAQGKLVKE